MTATHVLAEVLARARGTLGRSPEQVGEQVGVSGRTIRRLEEGASRRPRRTTLQALASYYGLNPEFMTALGAWSAHQLTDLQLHDRILERASRELGQDVTGVAASTPDADIDLAMRLSRAPQSGSQPFGAISAVRTHEIAAVLQELRAPGVIGATERERGEVMAAVGGLLTLDRHRRRLAAELIGQLREAQGADNDRRRPSGVGRDHLSGQREVSAAPPPSRTHSRVG